VLHDLGQGAAFVLGHRLLRPVLLTAFFFNTSFFLLQAIYVPYAVGRLGLTASAVGWTLAAYGAGMLLAATLARRVAAIVPFGVVIAIGPVAGLAAAAAMLLTVWVPSAAVAGASFFLIGAGPMLWVISTTTLRQAVTPTGQLGRVSAVITTATYGARPLGAAIGAGVGGWMGAEACLFAAAVGFMIQAAIILASPVPRLVRQPEMEAADQAPRRRGFAPPRPAPSPDA